MSEDDEIPIKPTEIIYGFNGWCKKNMFTVIGILIIMALVILDFAAVQKDKLDVVNKCNEFWFKQVELVCPVLFNQNNAGFDINLSKSNNFGLADSEDK